MTRIRLYLDEDVWLGLAVALREHGFDVVHAYDVDRGGLSDPEQLAYAAFEKRAILTHNAKDFVPLAVSYFFDKQSHAGIILARQVEKGMLLGQALSLLNQFSAEDVADTVRHLSDL
jgi:predicted nuclease of predicted toxin-antitoxin system